MPIFYASVDVKPALQTFPNPADDRNTSRTEVHAFVHARDRIEAGARLADLLREQGWVDANYRYLPVNISISMPPLSQVAKAALSEASEGRDVLRAEPQSRTSN